MGHSLTSKLMLLLTTLAVLAQPSGAVWGGETGSEDAFASTAQKGGGFDNDVDFSGEKKISAMNVLLPISNCAECRRVRFELQASNGCYSW